MAYYKATIDVLIDAESEAHACDAISESLRPMLKEFADNPDDTPWVDWRYHEKTCAPVTPTPHDGNGFEYAVPR